MPDLPGDIIHSPQYNSGWSEGFTDGRVWPRVASVVDENAERAYRDGYRAGWRYGQSFLHVRNATGGNIENTTTCPECGKGCNTCYRVGLANGRADFEEIRKDAASWRKLAEELGAP